MAIFRVTARWDGFPGAPGYSNFHFTGQTGGDQGEGERQLVYDFFQELNGILADQTTITVDQTITVYDEATGQMTDLINDDTDLPPMTVPGSGVFAGPVGAVINWRTGTVVNGRLLRGRTFVVPLISEAFDRDGTLTTAALADLNSAASVLSGAGFGSGFCVWSRPKNGSPGAVGEVTSHNVPDMAAVLRSRRD